MTVIVTTERVGYTNLNSQLFRILWDFGRILLLKISVKSWNNKTVDLWPDKNTND